MTIAHEMPLLSSELLSYNSLLSLQIKLQGMANKYCLDLAHIELSSPVFLRT